MSARIEVSSESGIVAPEDPTAGLPAGLDEESLLRRPEPLAHSAQIFCPVTDDPVRYRIDNRSPISRETSHVLYVAYAPTGVGAEAVEAQLGKIEDNVRLFAPKTVVEPRRVLSA